MGIFGVLFARELPSPIRLPVILLAVATPLFAARLYSPGKQRYLLIGATVLLMLGAMVMVSDVSGSLAALEDVPRGALEASRWIGAVSLSLGLLVIIFSVARTGEAIDEIGDRFRHLTQHMSEGFVLTAPDGAIVMVNARFTEMTGLPEAEVLGRSERSLSAGKGLGGLFDREEVSASATVEYQVTWRLGEEDREYWVSRTPIFDRRGVHAGALSTLRDITEQCRLSQSLEQYAQGLSQLVDEQTRKLHQSEARLRDLLVHMNEGFLAVDSAFRIRFANERVCELLGVSVEEVLNRDLFQYVEPTGRGRLLDLLEMVEAQHSTQSQQEFVLNTERGEHVPAVFAIAPISDSEESELRYSVVITNVSRLKLMQRQLEARAAELEAANEELKLIDRAKDGFLSNVSHELRTPLSTIRGYVEMLSSLSLGPLQEYQKNALQVISRNMQRLTVLIDEMIAFSRMEIKGVQLSLTLFSMEAMLQECLGSAEPQLMPKKLRAEVTGPGAFPLVWADRKKLVQVIGILFSNAVKFSVRGGELAIRMSLREANTVAVSVEDHGIGIDPAFHSRVFAKFFQVDSSLTRRYEGAGIGLSIAKSVVEAHGGSIELDSQLNEGSTFTVVLPRSVFVSDLPPLYQDCMSGSRVIVGADEREFRMAMAEVLERSGCRVTAVNKGYECIRAARDIAPHAVILDEVLPDLSGWVTAAKLHEESSLRAIPVLILTGSRSPSSLAEGTAGAAYLSKPFGASDLIAEVRRLLYGETPEPAEHPYEAAPSAKAPPCVLVVDRDTDVLEWVETALSHRQIRCVCAADRESGLKLAQQITPDLVFLDVDSLESEWSSAVRAFRAIEPTRHVPIYVMTALAPNGHEPDGARGVLRKPFSIRDVEHIIWGNLSPVG